MNLPLNICTNRHCNYYRKAASGEKTKVFTKFFKGLTLEKNHPINSFWCTTRAEIPNLQKLSCSSVFKNYINILAQINN